MAGGQGERAGAPCASVVERGETLERTASVMRRALPIGLIVALLCAYVPAQPVSALSTSSEVQLGRDADRQVQDAYTIVTDPLENAWVNDIAHKLWAQVVRKDLP